MKTMDTKKITAIYGFFITLAALFLFDSSIYYEAIKIKKTTIISNLQLLIINAISHIPHYIIAVIILLFIPILIDILYENKKRSKTDNDDEIINYNDIKNIYIAFIGFAIVILFYGTPYNTIIQMMNILASTNILITSINIPSIHIPFYIKVTMAILLIPMIIDVCYDMINMSKIAKTQGEELGELLLILIKTLIIISVILLLIDP
jgi:hypothetical protein